MKVGSGKTLLAGLILLSWVGLGSAQQAGLPVVEVRLAGWAIKAEVAQTDDQRRRGLSGRTALGDGEGMIFIYPDRKVRPFWMAGMRLPLDLVWLAEGRVVGLVRNLRPPRLGEPPATVTPPRPVDMVLEVAAGYLEAKEIRLGAPLELPPGFQARPDPD